MDPVSRLRVVRMQGLVFANCYRAAILIDQAGFESLAPGHCSASCFAWCKNTTLCTERCSCVSGLGPALPLPVVNFLGVVGSKHDMAFVCVMCSCSHDDMRWSYITMDAQLCVTDCVSMTTVAPLCECLAGGGPTFCFVNLYTKFANLQHCHISSGATLLATQDVHGRLSWQCANGQRRQCSDALMGVLAAQVSPCTLPWQVVMAKHGKDPHCNNVTEFDIIQTEKTVHAAL